MNINNKHLDWIVEQHRNTNHLYDGLPYEFHLRMVARNAVKFKAFLPSLLYTSYDDFNKEVYDNTLDTILLAAWGHDLIEDTRVTYNDVSKYLGNEVAEIIYALTNEKGKNRKERANDKYYEGIVNTKGATYVKLCDRIANAEYSKLTESSMFDAYRKENKDFGEKLRLNPNNIYYGMFLHLKNILEL